jgi:hypothetical protein
LTGYHKGTSNPERVIVLTGELALACVAALVTAKRPNCCGQAIRALIWGCLYTAHYDHLGVKKGEIYPGADDNASGQLHCAFGCPARGVACFFLPFLSDAALQASARSWRWRCTLPRTRRGPSICVVLVSD